MQSLTLLHSDSFPIGRYADGLVRESIAPRAVPNLDHLVSEPSSLRVILVDPAITGGKVVKVDARTAIVGVGLDEQPKWLTEDNVYVHLAGDPSTTVLLNAVKSAYQYLYQKMRADQLERQLSDRTRELKEVSEVGIALSTVRDHQVLLTMILSKARELSRADAGSLYLLDELNGERVLRWKLAQSDSIDVGSFEEKILPVTRKSLAGYVAKTGETLVIDDAYNLPADSEYSINTSFDAQNHYLTRSLLVFPMTNHVGDIIGVLQLINRKKSHAASHLQDATGLVVSSAIDEQNPEVQEARRRQIPVIPRGELLAELMRLKYGIAVAGSHGKTTTTSMTATILNFAGLDPTVVVGGRVGTMGGSNARVGRSDFLVVESDESDGSFLKLAPIIAIVTNIDREHLDHYPSLDAIRAAFIEFVNKVPFYGAAIVCLDDPHVQSILPEIRRRTITYGTTAQADLEASEIACGPFASDFRLRYREQDLGRFHLRIPGRHNVLNATAAVAAALELEVKPDTIRDSLATFSGVDRRFQVRGSERGITVVDDYGQIGRASCRER